MRRLGSDHFDLYQVHRPDPDVDVEDIEQDVLPTTQRHGMGSLTYSPLGGA